MNSLTEYSPGRAATYPAQTAIQGHIGAAQVHQLKLFLKEALLVQFNGAYAHVADEISHELNVSVTRLHEDEQSFSRDTPAMESVYQKIAADAIDDLIKRAASSRDIAYVQLSGIVMEGLGGYANADFETPLGQWLGSFLRR